MTNPTSIPATTSPETAPVKKRKRSNSVEEAEFPSSSTSPHQTESIPDYDIRTELNCYDKSTLIELLVTIAEDPKNTTLRDAKAVTFIDFSDLAADVGDKIVEEECDESGSQKFEAALEITKFVSVTIKSIKDQVKPHSAFGTKDCALETLLMIAWQTLGDGEEEFRKRLRMDFADGKKIEDSMMHVVRCMTKKERLAMRKDGFIEKLWKFGRAASHYAMYEDHLLEVGDFLMGEGYTVTTRRPEISNSQLS